MVRSLDVVFVDWPAGSSRMRVISVRSMRPPAFVRAGLRAPRVSVIELAAGEAVATGVEPGAELLLV